MTTGARGKTGDNTRKMPINCQSVSTQISPQQAVVSFVRFITHAIWHGKADEHGILTKTVREASRRHGYFWQQPALCYNMSRSLRLPSVWRSDKNATVGASTATNPGSR